MLKMANRHRFWGIWKLQNRNQYSNIVQSESVLWHPLYYRKFLMYLAPDWNKTVCEAYLNHVLIKHTKENPEIKNNTITVEKTSSWNLKSHQIDRCSCHLNSVFLCNQLPQPLKHQFCREKRCYLIIWLRTPIIRGLIIILSIF